MSYSKHRNEEEWEKSKKEKKEEEKKRNCKEKREAGKPLFKNKDENYSWRLNQRTGKQGESKLMLKKKFVNQPKNLYLLKLAFESEGEIFKNQDLEFITSQTALQEILRVIQREGKW